MIFDEADGDIDHPIDASALIASSGFMPNFHKADHLNQ